MSEKVDKKYLEKQEKVFQRILKILEGAHTGDRFLMIERLLKHFKPTDKRIGAK